MSTVPVVAVIRAKKGKEAVLEALLKEMVAATHKEAGCVRYALHRAQNDPSAFVFVERWASPKDLENHLAAPHIASAMARKDELIASMDIWPLEALPVDKTSMETF